MIFLHFFWYFISFVMTLGILITIHEFGHFLAARFFKVQVEKFAIGFGPVLFRWQDSKNTEYIISIIFFGGYVKLLDSSSRTVNFNQLNNAFDRKNIWKRIIIVLSGSFFNIIFSVLFYIIIFVIGIPSYKPIIGSVIPNSIIGQSSILPELEIMSINNVQTHDWDSVRLQILNNVGKEKIVIVTKSINDESFAQVNTIHLPYNWFNKCVTKNVKDPVLALGMIPANLHLTSIISKVQPNSDAELAGLRVEDEILFVDDQPVHDWNACVQIIKEKLGEIFKITIKRNEDILDLTMKLSKQHLLDFVQIEEVIGCFPKIVIFSEKYQIIKKYGLYQSIFQSCNKVWDLMYLVINTLYQLIIGNIGLTSLEGPISIAQGAGESAQSGIVRYLMFLALISINLGVINLIPLPVLDGGHVVFLIVEKIKGYPISKGAQKLGYVMGIVILILIMCVALFNDISKLWWS